MRVLYTRGAPRVPDICVEKIEGWKRLNKSNEKKSGFPVLNRSSDVILNDQDTTIHLFVRPSQRKG